MRSTTTVFLQRCDADSLAFAQRLVTAKHYLRTPVDRRCRPLAYQVMHQADAGPCCIGILIFGRPEATRCYQGGLRYGSQEDVRAGRAQFDRWEVLNLARVWIHPSVQAGGYLCDPDQGLPGYTDRKGVWRSTLASWAIVEALERVRLDYLLRYPPCFLDDPYQIRACLSYCNTRFHQGTLYQVSGFVLARTNKNGVATWWKALSPLTEEEDRCVRKCAERDSRCAAHRRRRRKQAEQHRMFSVGL